MAAYSASPSGSGPAIGDRQRRVRDAKDRQPVRGAEERPAARCRSASAACFSASALSWVTAFSPGPRLFSAATMIADPTRWARAGRGRRRGVVDAGDVEAVEARGTRRGTSRGRRVRRCVRWWRPPASATAAWTSSVSSQGSSRTRPSSSRSSGAAPVSWSHSRTRLLDRRTQGVAEDAAQQADVQGDAGDGGGGLGDGGAVDRGHGAAADGCRAGRSGCGRWLPGGPSRRRWCRAGRSPR